MDERKLLSSMSAAVPSYLRIKAVESNSVGAWFSNARTSCVLHCRIHLDERKLLQLLRGMSIHCLHGYHVRWTIFHVSLPARLQSVLYREECCEVSAQVLVGG